MDKQIRFRQFVLSLLLCCLCSVSQVAAQEKGVTIDVKNVSLREVLAIVEKQTTYRFSYRDVIIDSHKDITLSEQNISVPALLDRLLKEKQLNYSI